MRSGSRTRQGRPRAVGHSARAADAGEWIPAAQRDAFEASARAALAGDPELRAVIQADGQVPRWRVIHALDQLKAGCVRPVSLDQAAWNCPWPTEADAQKVDEQTVVLRANVRADGTADRVNVLSDPGFGFGSAARLCALGTRFEPARAAVLGNAVEAHVDKSAGELPAAKEALRGHGRAALLTLQKNLQLAATEPGWQLKLEASAASSIKFSTVFLL